jgi:endoglycosylceramidase
VFFHGVNAVWKLDVPEHGGRYYPPSSVYSEGAVPPEKSFFDERDAQFLAESGLNSVRLGVLWVGVEPLRDQFDDTYLDRIEELVDMLAARGVTVMLDFHQDMYNERFDGAGFPAWATDQTVPPTNCCGFPGNYFTPAVMRSFDRLWLNEDGLWDEYAEAWAYVAARFKDKPNLIGYDLLNEPWPGTQWWTCANPEGCPAFDVAFLQPFMERLIRGIRSVDPTGIIWWDPHVINNNGTTNHVGLLSSIADSGAANGLSFHTYCLIGGLTPFLSRGDDPECAFAADRTMQQQHEAAARNGSSLFLTEFGASDDLVDIGRTAALADTHMVSWQYWHYGEWSDPTTTGTGGVQGLYEDDLDRPGSLKPEKASVLIRPYPQAVAGTPVSFSFNPGTKEFRLVFESVPSIKEPTEIFVPVARHYGGQYAVAVEGPARVTSPPGAPLLTLKNRGQGTVTVTVTPA